MGGFPSSQLKADLRTIQTTDLHGWLLRFPQEKSPIVLNQQERLAGPSLSIFENKTSQRYLSRPSLTKIFLKKNVSQQLDKAFFETSVGPTLPCFSLNQL